MRQPEEPNTTPGNNNTPGKLVPRNQASPNDPSSSQPQQQHYKEIYQIKHKPTFTPTPLPNRNPLTKNKRIFTHKKKKKRKETTVPPKTTVPPQNHRTTLEPPYHLRTTVLLKNHLTTKLPRHGTTTRQKPKETAAQQYRPRTIMTNQSHLETTQTHKIENPAVVFVLKSGNE